MSIKAEDLASYWMQQIEAWQSSGRTQQAYFKVSAKDSAPLQPV